MPIVLLPVVLFSTILPLLIPWVNFNDKIKKNNKKKEKKKRRKTKKMMEMKIGMETNLKIEKQIEEIAEK